MAEEALREQHPLPAAVMHWVHLASIAVLIFTGFYIHGPFFGGGSMSLMRNLHFIFMFVLILTAIVRVWWAFLGGGSSSPGSRTRIRDSRHFGVQRENKGQSFQTLKYYLFLRRTHPPKAKYNPLQKLTYMFWLLLIVLQAVTGFAIWTPTQESLLPLTYLLGGVMYVRMYHYVIMWLFIITTAVHIYLSLAEGFIEFPLMFWWRERRGPRAVGTEK